MNLRARKSLGQNFLVDPGYQQRIVAALEPAPEDTIVEVGPGPGALTRHLAATGARLHLIELDERFVGALAREYADREDIEVLHRDALRVDLAALGTPPDRIKVIGNIPYNITTPLIFHLLRREARPALIVFMIQREVADRILAAPGGRQYGALTVGVRSLCAVERLFHVPRGAFRPVPGVDSTVLRLRPYRPPPLGAREEEELRTLTRVTFGWRRKQLGRILREAPLYQLPPEGADALAEAGFDLQARPETLAPERFVALAAALRARGLPHGHADQTGWE